jgi:hydroxymethylpyrimidine pyrophosphatase-like HAD family hydrolase
MDKFSVAFDCDGTLMNLDGTINTRLVDFAKSLIRAGFVVYVWSGGGIEYARDIARSVGLDGAIIRFKGDVKPDLCIDDMPGIKLAQINLTIQ